MRFAVEVRGTYQGCAGTYAAGGEAGGVAPLAVEEQWTEGVDEGESDCALYFVV